MRREISSLVLVLVLIGCNTAPTPVSVLSARSSPAPRPTNTVQRPPITSTSRPRLKPTSSPRPTLTPLPIATLVLEGIALPSGLIYLTPEILWQDKLWQIDLDGKPTLIFSVESPHRVTDLLPDGTHVLYVDLDNGGVWMADLRTGERSDLTKNLLRNVTETSAQWWPGQPNKIILGSYLNGDDSAPSNGYLTELRLDTPELKVLDKDNLFFGAAVSPDGTKIAYDNGGSSAWLYQEGKGYQAFRPQRYGLAARGQIGIGSASWSPDGKKLAWVVAGNFNGEGERFGVAVFDLQHKTYQLLNLYQIAGTDMWPRPALWSPDGQWLAIDAIAEGDDNGLWVSKVDGTEKYHLTQSLRSVVWSPDSKFLAFTADYPDFSAWLTKVGDWQLKPLAMPIDAEVLGWVKQPTR